MTFNVVTTAVNGGAVAKPFTWSYSRLKNFEACPKKHFHVDIAKDIKEEYSEALRDGDVVHAALAARLSNGAPLPSGLQNYEQLAARVSAPPYDKLLTEQKLGLTADFAPCGFFDRLVWLRVVLDVVKITGPVALVGDWKTGKIKEDGVQLALGAVVIFAHHPEVMAVRSEFFWLGHDATSRVNFSRNDIPKVWQNVWPRIEALRHAHESATYPPKPGGLCRRWCPVSSCPHHGT